jgi:hypothetical protein
LEHGQRTSPCPPCTRGTRELFPLLSTEFSMAANIGPECAATHQRLVSHTQSHRHTPQRASVVVVVSSSKRCSWRSPPINGTSPRAGTKRNRCCGKPDPDSDLSCAGTLSCRFGPGEPCCAALNALFADGTTREPLLASRAQRTASGVSGEQ